MHNIEYEGMHMIWLCCGKYCHDKDQCTQKTEVAPNLIIAAQPTGEKENQATGSGRWRAALALGWRTALALVERRSLLK